MLTITTTQFEHFGEYAVNQFPKAVSSAIRQDFTDSLTHINDHHLLILVSKIIERMRLLGFEQKTHLHHLTAWELFLGPDFENITGYETVKTWMNIPIELSAVQTSNQEAERFWGVYRAMMDIPENINS